MTPRPFRRPFLSLCLRAAACMTVAACGGGDAPPVAPSGTLAIAAPSAALRLTPGHSGSDRVTVTRGGGFGGTVTLAAADVPAGLTATFSPSALTADVSESVVTATASVDIAPGSYELTVVGTGAGVTRTAAAVRVEVVRVPAPAPAITVAAPAALRVDQGATGAAAIAFTRTGFAGEVTVALADAPPGVSAAPVTVSAAASEGALAVQVAATVPAGARQLAVRLTGPGGSPSATATLPLTVTPAPVPDATPGAYTAIGRVTGTRGEPLAGVEVVLDNQLLHGSYVTATTDAAGRYRATLPPIAVTWAASASMVREFDGARYKVALAPVDPTAFAGNTGGVRDFVWHLRGAGPDDTWYGSPVIVYASLQNLDLDERDVELTLTPVGPLIDGSAGAVIVGRAVPTGDGFGVPDVPIGRYTVTAREVVEGSAPRLLQVRVRNAGEYAGSLTTGFAAPYGQMLGVYRIDLEVRR